MRKFNIKVNGQAFDVEVEEVGGGVPVMSAPVVAPPVAQAPVAAPVAQAAPIKVVAPVAASGNGTKLIAPMPGLVLATKVESGAKVKKGQVVVVLEAMKMENDIIANADGVITLAVSKGANVNSGDVLATIA